MAHRVHDRSARARSGTAPSSDPATRSPGVTSLAVAALDASTQPLLP